MDVINEYYHYAFIKSADPRTATWPLIASPLPLLSILVAYLYAVYIYLPNYMSDKKPYQLKETLVVYNIFQVVACILIIHGMATSGWTPQNIFGCHECDFSNDKMAVRIAGYIWWTFMLKLLELAETVMFVLRKKFSQVSDLHVYHHVSTVVCTWLAVKYYAGGSVTFPIVLNSIVHIIMYTYYYLSSLGGEMKKRLEGIKSKITTIQIIQLVLLIFHSMQILIPSCNIPTIIVYAFIPNVAVNLILFLKFYKRSYKLKASCSND